MPSLRLTAGLCLASGVLVACPEPGPACPDGELLDERTESCVPEACGSGDWGAAEPDADAAHVAPWGRADATGSRDDPFDSLGAALESADGSVLIAAGSYRETLSLRPDEPRALRGRCRELVVLDGSGDDESPAVHLERGELLLADLTVSGAPAGGLRAAPTGLAGAPLLRLERITVTDCGNVGVAVASDKAALEAQDLRVLDMTEGEDGARGIGVRMDGGRIAASDLRIEGAGEAGLLAFDGPIDIEGLVVRDVTLRADGLRGRGLSIRDGARATLSDVVIEEVGEAGLTVSSGSTVEVTGLRVRGVSGTADGAAGFGVAAITGGSITVLGADVEDTQAPAFAARGEGSVVDVADAAVRGCKGGFQADGDGLLLIDGAVVEDTERWGLNLFSAGAEVSDLVIRRTIAGSEDLEAVGVALTDASLTARGLVIEDSARRGMALFEGSRAELVDSVVQGSFKGGVELPHGILVRDRSELIADGLLVADNEGVGILLWDGVASLTDTTVRGTLDLDGEHGRGVTVGFGGALTATGLRVEANRDIGLLVSGAGSEATLTDSEVFGTASALLHPSGAGIAVQDGGTLTLDGTLVRENEGPGLYVARAGVTVRDSALQGNGFAGAVCAGGRLDLIGGSVSGTTPDASHGGGVGLYARSHLAPATVTAVDVTFSELLGPALYLRGPGDYLLQGSVVRSGGSPPSLAGGVMAVEGARGPEGDEPGLVIEDTLFDDIAGDAILLDASGALLAEGESGNRFVDVSGEPLYRQRCGPEVLVLDDSGADPACRESARPLGPPLEYLILVEEGVPVD